MDSFLFVYGTLREGVGHPMHGVLKRYAEAEGPAQFSGRLYNLGRYPAAVPDDSGEWHVAGELYRLLKPGIVLERLDAYEGCAPKNPHPHEYKREVHSMKTGAGERPAWIYLYNRPLAAAQPIPSGDYLEGASHP